MEYATIDASRGNPVGFLCSYPFGGNYVSNLTKIETFFAPLESIELRVRVKLSNQLPCTVVCKNNNLIVITIAGAFQLYG